MALLSKLEVRFNNAGFHEYVKFVIITNNKTNINRIRNYSRQLDVITVSNSSRFAQLEDRSIYIFNDCGQVVFVIHYPFSSVQKPFVKAAILSAVYDEPCGACEDHKSTTTTDSSDIIKDFEPIQHFGLTAADLDTSMGFSSSVSPSITPDDSQIENEILKHSTAGPSSSTDDGDSDSSSYSSYVIPLKIILPVEHLHKSNETNSFARYNYILLKMDDPSYHQHIYSDNSDILVPEQSKKQTPTQIPISSSDSSSDTSINNIEITTEMLNDKSNIKINETEIDIDENGSADKILIDTQGYRYELGKHYKIMNENGAAVDVEFDDIEMVRPRPMNKQKIQISRRIQTDDDEVKIENGGGDSKIASDQTTGLYEGHYMKIFGWLHYQL